MAELYQVLVSDSPLVISVPLQDDPEFSEVAIIIDKYAGLLTNVEIKFTRVHAYSFTFYFRLSALYLLENLVHEEVISLNLGELLVEARKLYSAYTAGEISVTDAINNNIMIIT
ncbi:hypothetical protein ABGV42_00410 [Paenibacillus pabuli]|uniref:hypothetical protein n=1 Tax=Paenibacillus pabuli TaxID=1472 RepID=UPI003242A8E7